MKIFKKLIYIVLIMLLIVIIAISSIILIKQFSEERKQSNEFEELEEIINVKENEKIEDINNFNHEYKIDLKKLYNINQDIIGWIKIDGTHINYPVMQNGEYYLKRNIYKNYSSYGTPFLAEYCDIDTSDNLIIYGHNMKNKEMFADLINYKNKNFYNKNKYIKFYVLEENQTIKQIYEVIFAFTTIVNLEKSFKYYSFNKANNKDDFDNFISSCKNRQIYETGNSAKYGDKIITLSTCEYSQNNSRMVVIARKIN